MYCFNPRPPCGERPIVNCYNNGVLTFQSTPPVRGATHLMLILLLLKEGFNPRPPCGERLQTLTLKRQSRCFNPRPPCGERLTMIIFFRLLSTVSIHAPRAGSDRYYRGRGCKRGRFQSTPPVRGATGNIISRQLRVRVSIHAPRAGSDRTRNREVEMKIVSIHAPRAGSDNTIATLPFYLYSFNPRPPCGERQPRT